MRKGIKYNYYLILNIIIRGGRFMKKSKRKTGLTFKPVISRYGDYITKELKYPEIKNSGVEEKLEIEKKVLWNETVNK